MERTVSVQEADFDSGAEAARLAALGGDCGAIVSFVGLCRSEDDRLRGLQIEAYPEMAASEIAAIIDNAAMRWRILGARVVHRYGTIAAGEQIVFTGVSSRHRSDAFLATQFIMDFLKHQAPFWKRELLATADLQAGDWVQVRQADVAALHQWESDREQ